MTSRPWLQLLHRHRYRLLLGGIVLVAVFLRFWKLASLPPGLFPDEAANGLDVFRILEQNDLRPLYNTNGPREALFFYIQAAFVALIGNTILALRLAPAMIGSLAVPVTYLWVKSWFGQRTALIAAFLMAVSPWAITMSRIGFRASMVPLFIPLTLWLYTRGFQTGRRKWFILAGASLGAGMYTYLSFRLFPLALLAVVGALWLWRREFIRRWWRMVGVSLIAALVVFSPMLLFGLKYPGDVFGARSSTSFTNPELNNGQPLQTLLDTIGKTALMFNVHGDENYRHNLGGEPMLNVFVGVMFILGALICVTKLRSPRYFALLAVFGVMLLPEVLTAEGIPHALRAIGAMPTVFVLAALGIGYMLDQWYRTFPVNAAARSAGLAAMLLLLGLTAFQGYMQYFVAWANSPETYEAYSEDAVAVARFLNQNRFEGERYAVVHGFSDITVLYLTHGKAEYRRIDPGDISQLPKDGAPKQFVIGQGFKAEAIKRLTERFPEGRVSPHYSDFSGNELFLVYEVTK